MKIDEKVWANASAALVGVIYLACGLLVAIAPNFMMAVARSWFHGIDLTQNWSGRAFPGNFLLGLVSAVVASWLTGYLFAWLYNYFADRK